MALEDCAKGCPPAYMKIIEIAGKWMAEEYPHQPVTLALDTEHNGVNIPLNRSIENFLYRSRVGKSMKYIFPSSF